MMSTEFPEILPEPFSNPCVSYNGNAENFIGEVHCSTHNSLYNRTGYYSDSGSCSFDSETNHHSLILEDPVLGHSLESLNANGRSSCSHQSNFQVANSCIKLVVKEAMESFPADCGYMDDMPCHEDDNLQDNLDSVQVVIECADEEGGGNALSRAMKDLLRPSLRRQSPCTSESNCDSPTPTPSSRDLVFSPSIEYPEAEEKAFYVRGEEVAAGLEEAEDIGTDDLIAGNGSGYHPKLVEEDYPEEYVQESRIPDEPDRRLPLDVADSHIVSNHVLRIFPKRHSHLSHLKFAQSPHALPLPTVELRKLSDPAIQVRRQRLKTSSEPKRQRCLSDSEAPFFHFPVDEDELKSEEGCSSALGCDSGFHDGRNLKYQDYTYFSSPRVSLYSSDLHSQEENSEQTAAHLRLRRVTPHSLLEPFVDSSQLDDQNSVPVSSNPGTMVYPRERSRRSLLKHFSQSSLGGVSVGGGSVGGASSLGASSESPSLGSLLETQSNLTCATDILSSLGFEDFDSPQLVPDRFIPKDLEYLRPSSMKAAFIEQNLSTEPPQSPDSLTSANSSNPPTQQRSMELSYLPLGATAENFLPGNVHSGTDVAVANSLEIDQPVPPATPTDTTPLFTNTIAFTRHRILETVPEETASDLSLSPRWLSPRVSIDHSVNLDFTDGKLLNIPKVRRRSLPTREGYKLSIGSLVESDTGDSIHLSVTSYDDEIAAEREREREALMSGVIDDITMGTGRRRRRGVYTPPQTLLSWLSTQKTIDEEVDTDPEELPWPFNEQARLRKSLTEISLAQQVTLTEEDSVADNTVAPDDDNVTSQREVSLSPISSPDVRLSPQPSLSEEELDGRVSPEQRHGGLTSPARLSPDIAGVATGGENRSISDTTPHHHHQHSGASLTPHVTPARPRRAPISPLNANRSSLPHLSEGFRTPSVDEPNGNEQRSDTNLEVLRHPANALIPPSSLLRFPSLSDSKPPAPTALTPMESCEQEKIPTMTKPTEELGVFSITRPETSPKNCRTRRPRLSTLRQDSLPEDMSEIELLTGDIHSPVLSSKVPFRKQENLEELPPSRALRSSRRVAVIGEAPSAAELFADTSPNKSMSEYEKYMLL